MHFISTTPYVFSVGVCLVLPSRAPPAIPLPAPTVPAAVLTATAEHSRRARKSVRPQSPNRPRPQIGCARKSSPQQCAGTSSSHTQMEGLRPCAKSVTPANPLQLPQIRRALNTRKSSPQQCAATVKSRTSPLPRFQECVESCPPTPRLQCQPPANPYQLSSSNPGHQPSP
jgi:hypothetical protein